MRLLDVSATRFLADRLIQNLPRLVLSTISSKIAMSKGAILGTVSRQLPSNIQADELRTRCLDSVRWFVHNGDIVNSGNSRYVALPPYIVMRREGDAQVFYIFGSSKYDANINKFLNSMDSKLKVKQLNWSWQPQTEKSVGAQRYFELSEITDAVERKFSDELGISLVDPQILMNSLPSIHQLKIPALRSFTSHAPLSGHWFSYKVQHGKIGWQEVTAWEREAFCALKWVPTWPSLEPGKKGEDSTWRYFLYSGEGKLFEMSRSLAHLWELLFENQHGLNKNIWIKSASLWVPEQLPDAYHQWLRLVSSDWHRDGHLRKYTFVARPNNVCSKLAEALGLKVIEASPPGEMAD